MCNKQFFSYLEYKEATCAIVDILRHTRIIEADYCFTKFGAQGKFFEVRSAKEIEIGLQEREIELILENHLYLIRMLIC